MRVRGHLVIGAAVAFVTGCLVAAPALAASVYSVSGTSDPVTAVCSGTVCASLRAAVVAANAHPGSTIQLGAATYTLSQDALELSANVTITGGGPSMTTIRQTAAKRVILSDVNTEVGISGVTITGGHLTGAGGTSPTSDALGGGILNDGAMTLTNVAVTDNVLTGGTPGGSSGGTGGAALGSAIESGDLSSLTLIDATVTGNTAQGGDGGSASAGTAGTGGEGWGAIYGSAGSMVGIHNSTISDNHSTGGQGGAAIAPSGSSGHGGVGRGAVTSDGVLAIVDSTITANTAAGGIGGVSTINTADAGGGGDAVGGGVSSGTAFGATVTITGSTLAGNSVVGGSGGLAISPGITGGLGGDGDGGGIAAASAKIVNATVTGSSATQGAAGAGNSSRGEGNARAGGIWGDGSVTLASVTIAGNSAIGSSAFGGNLASVSATSITLADTIVAGGTAIQGSNCLDLSGGDSGHNLEDTTPSQCGLSSAKSDLIGANAGLSPLASNGGLTQTRGLVGGSQALSTGGACTDPSQVGSPPLSVDQRGLPRPAGGCDIGAFQFEAPAAARPPQIAGTPAVGQKLSCSPGAWSGDQLAFAYQWLRDTAPITAATGVNYTVASADTGHPVACQETASNVKGTASQTSAAITIASLSSGGGGGTSGGGGSVAPIISGARETHKVWVRGTALPRISRRRTHPVGTVFSFMLNQPASVRLAFLLGAPGRKVANKCVVPNKHNHRKHRCTRPVAAGNLTLSGHPRLNRISFQGRLSRTKTLKPGNYTLLITATNTAALKSAPQTLRFTILKQ